MAEENQAGKMILSNIGMFNEAVVLFEKIIEPAIMKSIGECVEAFAKSEQWINYFDNDDGLDCWLAPSQWNVDSDPKAKFDLNYTNDDDGFDCWHALFCNQGSTGGEAGFMFYADEVLFGKKRAWNNNFKTIDGALVDKLKNIGFKVVDNDGKKTFFLPVHLDALQIAEIWGNDGEFSGDDSCFEPLKSAMEKLKMAWPTFDAILNAWPVKS